MPAANAIDGHNWMFPIAFGFFDSKTKENWIWFMEQLGKALGPLDKLAVCTYACKGLEAAVKQVFPMAKQRECFRHLMDNLKKRFNQGKSSGCLLGQYMWPAARAYTEEKYQRLMAKVVVGSADILPWLNEHHKLLWARSKFTLERKCDYINNNLAES
jgi:transposase-like protein